MKVLLISNMYPSEQKPYAGIFVKNQFEELQERMEASESVSIHYMLRTFTGPIGSMWKYFVTFFKFTPHYFKSYEVIHLHYFYPLIICAWIYKLLHPKTKVICTFHGTDVTTQLSGGLNQKIFYYLSQCIDLGIPVGKMMQDEVNKKLAPIPTTVLCAGVNHHFFYPPKQTIPRSDKIFDFTWVGTFEHRKGLDLYVKAIRKLDRKDLKFCFIGSGPLELLLDELKHEFNLTIINDLNQNQIREEFYRSQYQILCSRNEPFGLVVSEAMFCGVPACVTASGGMAEQVQNGVNGFIANEIHVEGIMDMMQRALDLPDDLYSHYSQMAIKNTEIFSLDSVVTKHLKFYRSLAQGQDPQSLVD